MTIISRDELKELIELRREYVLVDVREPEEIQFGMIETAINIPVKNLAKAFAHPEEYGLSKAKPTIFYARVGHRSALAANFARRRGFNAYNYKGGIVEWAKLDKRIEVYY